MDEPIGFSGLLDDGSAILDIARKRAEQIGLDLDVYISRSLPDDLKQSLKETFPDLLADEKDIENTKAGLAPLIQTPQAQQAMVDAALSPSEKGGLLSLADQIFEMAPPEIRSRFTREQVTYELRSLNLGIGERAIMSDIPASTATVINSMNIPKREAAMSLIEKFLLTNLYRSKSPVEAKKKLDDIGGNITRNTEVYRMAAGKVRSKIRYWGALLDRSEKADEGADEDANLIKPTFAQSLRTRAFVRGDAESIMLNDATSAGKTFTAISMVGLADKKKRRMEGESYRRPKILLISPEQAIRTGWKQSEIDRYTRSLGLSNGESRFRIGYVKDADDFENVVRDNDIIAFNYSELGYRRMAKTLVKLMRPILEKHGLVTDEFKSLEKSASNSHETDQEKKEVTAGDLHDFVKSLKADATIKEEIIEIINQPNRFNQLLMEHASEFDYVIVDEAHGFRNTSAERTKSFKEFREATKGKRYVLLSATPMFNEPSDLGVQFYLLDPARYPFANHSDQNAVRDFVGRNMWWTITRDDIRELYGLPELEESVEYFELDPDLEQDYLSIHGQIIPEGEIGIQNHDLTRVLLQAGVRKLKSVVERELKEKPDAQIAIFSYLKTGIFDDIKNTLEQIPALNNRVAFIHGDVDFDDENGEGRVQIAKKFRDGEYRSVVSTIKTMGEAISLSPGNRPIIEILLQPPDAIGDYEQLIGRGYRYGQKGGTKVIQFVPQLSVGGGERMRADKERQLQQSGKHLRPTWKPSTIFEDKVVNLNGYREMQRDNVEATNRRTLRRLLEEDTARQSPRAKTPEQIAASHFHRAQQIIPFLTGIGSDEFIDIVNKPEDGLTEKQKELKKVAQRMLEMYEHNKEILETLPNGNLNRMIGETIRYLENNEETKFGRIIDAGCGTATLQRVMRRGIVNVDGWKEMLRKGKDFTDSDKEKNAGEWERFDEQFAENYVQGDYRFLDKLLPAGRFDVVNFSNTWQYVREDGNQRREIHDSVMSANRVLRMGGYITIVLGKSNTPEDAFNEIVRFVKAYGFETVLTGLYGGRSNGKKIFDTNRYIVAKKVREVGDPLPVTNIGLYTPHVIDITALGGYTKRAVYARDRPMDSQPRSADDFASEDGISLIASLEKGLEQFK